MRQLSPFLETSVAPSPIVRTSRAGSKLSACEYHDKSPPITSAMTSSHDSRIQARSAGAAERPMKDENVVELMRFFQASSDSPVSPVSPVVSQNPTTSNIFKAGHRRLRQLAMRQKKESESKSKSDDSHHHLTAIQQGESPAVPKSKSSQLKGDVDPTLSHSRSLDTMFTNSKSEVENIGQPWLEDTSEKAMKEQRSHRLSPLDLEEFTSMIRAAESSCPNVREETPPSYEQSMHAARGSGESQNQPGFPDSGFTGTSQSGYDGSPEKSNEMTDASHSHQHTENNSQPGNEYSDGITALPSEPDSQLENPTPEKSTHQSSEGDGASGHAKTPSDTSSLMHTSQRSISHPLKLFPEPPPPRTSSRGVWRTTPGSRRPSLASSAASDERGRSPPATERRSGSPMPLGNVLSHMDAFPRPAATHSRKPSNSDNKPGNRGFLSMEEINAFPLPAPNRPPPDLPKDQPAYCGPKSQNENLNSKVIPMNATPRYLPSLSRLPSVSGWKMLSENAARSSSPGPAACSGALPVPRESTANQDGVSQPASTNQSSSIAVTPQSRAEKVRALRMKDISQRRQQLKTGKLPLEEASSAPPQAESHQSGQESSTVQRNSRDLRIDTGRRNQRIAVPDPASPPPTSPLPLDPPIRPPNADPHGRRYRNSPPGSIAASVSRSAATSPDPGRSPRIHRSASARSASICHGMTSNEKKSFDYSESAIPSSDDEGQGTTRSSRALSSSRRAKRASRRSDSSALRITTHSRKQAHHDFGPPLSPRSEATSKSPPSPRSDYTFRSTDNSTSVIQSLETRIANLERQNKILQAALAAALDASGKQMPDTLVNSLTSSFSVSKASARTGRSSITSNSSSNESTWSMKQGKAKLKKSPSHQDSWHVTRDSSSFSSLESSMKDDGSHTKELEHAMRDLEYGWLPSVGEIPVVRS